MTMPPKPVQPTAPASRPNAAPKASPAPQIVQPAPPRRGGGIGRFFQTIFLLMLAFGAGYVYMGQEIQADRNEMLTQQAWAQERIEALEQELVQLTETRDNANTVEVDLTEVFAPIKTAISRLAEAQMELVAREISTELTAMVETDVQEVNASTAGMPMTSTAETEAAVPTEAAITTPATPTPATPAAEEAPPPTNMQPDTNPDPTDQKPAETSRSTPPDGLVTTPPAASESAPTASNSESGSPDTSADSGALDLAPTNDSAFSAAPPGDAQTPSPASFLPTALDSDVANNLMNKQIPAFLDSIGQITESMLVRMVEMADTAIDHATVSGWIPADSQDGDDQRVVQ